MRIFLLVAILGFSQTVHGIGMYERLLDLDTKMDRAAQEGARVKMENRKLALEIQKMEMEAAERQAAHEARMRQQQQQFEQDRANAAAKNEADLRFWNEVRIDVPDYQEIFRSERFVRWIDRLDPLTGIPPRTYLDDAVSNYYSGRVVATLKEYKSGKILPAASSKIIASSEQDFLTELSRVQSKWTKIESDPAFQEWLDTEDARTGIRYRTYQSDAKNAFDVSRIERIYAAFLFTLPALPPYMKDNSSQSKKTKKMV